MNVRSSDVRSAAMSPPPPIVRAASGNGASLTGNGASHAGNGHAPSNGLDRTRLFDHLQRRIMEELGFTDEIDPDQPLNEVGLDSLRSVALSNRLEKDFGVPVPVAELIAGPSIRQLSDLVASALSRTGQHPPMLMAATEARPAEREAAPPPPIVFEVAGTTGSKGLDLRLGADFAPDANTPRQFGAIAGGRAERDRNGGNGVQHGAPQIAAGFVGDGRNGGASHVVEPQPGQRVETRSVQRDSAPPPRTSGKWLIAPQPNPNAAVRLFCFPYAGGGVASFRGWPQLAHDALEIVAIEPPGRGTRINEAAVEDIDSFVEGLMPELIEWLDRPSAFFGHCLGGLTMFATLCALPDAATKFIKYAFACGIRPPNRLKRRGRFEDNLAYRMMLHPAFNIRIPPYEQDDELFADIVRQFDTPAADRMLAIQKLRKLLLPAIRSEFGMAYNYRYRPVAPFRFPIASFVGTSDPWVSVEDSAAWGDFTRGPFKNHVREGSHFLMIDDQDYILDTINRDFVAATLRRTTLQ
jgi:surfactin synthase thioesterase subunit/acyl carrier protein